MHVHGIENCGEKCNELLQVEGNTSHKTKKSGFYFLVPRALDAEKNPEKGKKQTGETRQCAFEE